MSVQSENLTQDRVRVVNLHEEEWTAPAEYIGRPSILGNPYSLFANGATRVEVVERYRSEWLRPIVDDGRAGRWKHSLESEVLSLKSPAPLKGWPWGMGDDARQAVWEAVLGLARRLAAGETLTLLCYCHPLPCHGDVLAKCLRWLAGKERGSVGAGERGHRQ